MAKNRTQPVFMASMLWKFVFCLLTLTSAVAEDPDVTLDNSDSTCHGTRLVVLAGPRRAATASVAEFFHLYARGTQPKHKQGRLYHPLQKFRWPLVYGEHSNQTETEMPYKRFNHLVTDSDNEPLRKEILDAIKRDYDQAGVNTVIFGGEEFDQVSTPSSLGQYDAIQAVMDVMEYVDAPPQCVSILLNYRVPRFEHWVSLYSSLAVTGEEDAQEFIPYEEHMCEDESMNLRLNELGTSMNPMYLAETYLAAGEGKWNVQMIDMAGVEAAGTDISHTIACSILGAKCDDDGTWVKGHIEEVITNNVLERDFKSLKKHEVKLAERVFEYRDCGYQEDLENNERFEIILQDTIWSNCHHNEDNEWVYQSFRPIDHGTHLVFDALLSQLDCSEYGGHPAVGGMSHSEELEAANIEDFLDGSFQKSHSFMEEIEELEDEIENSGFSVPLILAVVMFAVGTSFYVVKMRNPDYTIPIPSFEMGAFGDGVSRGFSDGVGRFSDSMGMGGRVRKQSDDDDSSSSSEESDDDDSDAGEFI